MPQCTEGVLQHLRSRSQQHQSQVIHSKWGPICMRGIANTPQPLSRHSGIIMPRPPLHPFPCKCHSPLFQGKRGSPPDAVDFKMTIDIIVVGRDHFRSTAEAKICDCWGHQPKCHPLVSRPHVMAQCCQLGIAPSPKCPYATLLVGCCAQKSAESKPQAHT